MNPSSVTGDSGAVPASSSLPSGDSVTLIERPLSQDELGEIEIMQRNGWGYDDAVEEIIARRHGD